jgi:hypothetical protein
MFILLRMFFGPVLTVMFSPDVARTASHVAHQQHVLSVQRQGASSTVLADAIVTAAEVHATSAFPVELLLALADVESDFDPTATSRLTGSTWDRDQQRWVGGVRVTGRWRTTKRPPRTAGNYFCGVVQATAATWQHCLALRDPAVAMQTTVASLIAWKRRSGGVRRALQGYGCGNAGLKGACKRYARRVLARRRLFMPG